jgi:hypothetical protein
VISRAGEIREELESITKEDEGMLEEYYAALFEEVVHSNTGEAGIFPPLSCPFHFPSLLSLLYLSFPSSVSAFPPLCLLLLLPSSSPSYPFVREEGPSIGLEINSREV